MAEGNASGAKEEAAEEVETPMADLHEAEGKGSWAHAAFHVATTIATPAAYAPLPFAVASLGWPLGQNSFSFSPTPLINLSFTTIANSLPI